MIGIRWLGHTNVDGVRCMCQPYGCKSLMKWYNERMGCDGGADYLRAPTTVPDAARCLAGMVRGLPASGDANTRSLPDIGPLLLLPLSWVGLVAAVPLVLAVADDGVAVAVAAAVTWMPDIVCITGDGAVNESDVFNRVRDAIVVDDRDGVLLT